MEDGAAHERHQVEGDGEREGKGGTGDGEAEGIGEGKEELEQVVVSDDDVLKVWKLYEETSEESMVCARARKDAEASDRAGEAGCHGHPMDDPGVQLEAGAEPPRKGVEWHQLTVGERERATAERRLAGCVITCVHGDTTKHTGRMIVPKANGSSVVECCAHTAPMEPELMRTATRPQQVLDVEAYIALLEQYPDWYDRGFAGMLRVGVHIFYCGKREGFIQFDNHPSASSEEGAKRLALAWNKDIKGLPNRQGIVIPHVIELGTNMEEASAKLWRLFPELQDTAPYLRVNANGVVMDRIDGEIVGKSRSIDDMTYGDDPRSVNNCTPGAVVPQVRLVIHPDFERAITIMRRRRPGVQIMMRVLDAKSFFRLFRHAVKDLPLCCLEYDGTIYCRLGCGFGGVAYPAMCSRSTGAMGFILRKQGVTTGSFIDDLAALEYEDRTTTAWLKVETLYTDINMPRQDTKDTEWSPLQVLLGRHYDLKTNQRSIAPTRLEKSIRLIVAVERRQKVGPKLMQRLDGSLRSVDQLVEGGRILMIEIHRIAVALAQMQARGRRKAIQKATGEWAMTRVRNRGQRGRGGGGECRPMLAVTADLRMELKWYKALLTANVGTGMNMSLPNDKITVPALAVSTDASEKGIGGWNHLKNQYFVQTFTSHEREVFGDIAAPKDQSNREYFIIAVLELWALVVGLAIWGPELGKSGERHTIFVDNQNVETWCSNGRISTDNRLVAVLLREYHWLKMNHGLRLRVVYVTSCKNKHADALSREQFDRFQLLTASSGCVRVPIPTRYQTILSRLSQTSSGMVPSLTQKNRGR